MGGHKEQLIVKGEYIEPERMKMTENIELRKQSAEEDYLAENP